MPGACLERRRWWRGAVLARTTGRHACLDETRQHCASFLWREFLLAPRWGAGVKREGGGGIRSIGRGREMRGLERPEFWCFFVDVVVHA